MTLKIHVQCSSHDMDPSQTREALTKILGSYPGSPDLSVVYHTGTMAYQVPAVASKLRLDCTKSRLDYMSEGVQTVDKNLIPVLQSCDMMVVVAPNGETSQIDNQAMSLATFYRVPFKRYNIYYERTTVT